MDNHEHLFVETPRANLSAGMQFLNGSYTSYFNLRHRRPGHLFQGRFKSLLVEEVNYFDQISRYVHLNPCGAGLAKLPEDYRWSSYRGYHRAGTALDWVTYRRVLREFGRDAATARRRYRRYVLAGLDQKLDSPWDRAMHGLVQGSEKFVSKVQALVADRAADASLPQLKQLRDRPSLARIVAATAKVMDVPVKSLTGRRRGSRGGGPRGARGLRVSGGVGVGLSFARRRSVGVASVRSHCAASGPLGPGGGKGVD